MFSTLRSKKLLVLFTLALCFWAVIPLAFAQGAGGGGGGGGGGEADKKDSNPGTASDIREDFYKRMKNAKSFSPKKYGGEDVIVDYVSIGPGTVHHKLTGPVQVWPVPVEDAVSIVPTLRDQGIMRNPLITFGLPISDTQYQVLHRYNQNIFLEQLFDPEKVIWVINAMGMIQSQSAANSAANLERNQSTSAIEYVEKYLPNFTVQAGNRWNVIRDQLFVPMAVLLLLPGAVLAQIKAIVAQGTPLFEETNPFDGIIRSIIAIFFIPATYLVVNYGIDVSNSMSLTIRDNYQRIFHSNMFKDAECAEKRAFPIRPKTANDNGIFRSTKPQSKGGGDLQAWRAHETSSYDIFGPDPCAGGGGGSVNDLADETTPVLMNASRLAVNIANVGLAGTWNVMCAFQLAYLHYLFLIGPIVAALWVWPLKVFRDALGSWIEGVLTICFWALFWNTTILLMACFRNVCETGTVIMTALNGLAVYSVQHAFNFAGLVQAGGREAASAASESGGVAAGKAAAIGAKSGTGAQAEAMKAAHQVPGVKGPQSAAEAGVGKPGAGTVSPGSSVPVSAGGGLPGDSAPGKESGSHSATQAGGTGTNTSSQFGQNQGTQSTPVGPGQHPLPPTESGTPTGSSSSSPVSPVSSKDTAAPPMTSSSGMSEAPPGQSGQTGGFGSAGQSAESKSGASGESGAPQAGAYGTAGQSGGPGGPGDKSVSTDLPPGAHTGAATPGSDSTKMGNLPGSTPSHGGDVVAPPGSVQHPGTAPAHGHTPPPTQTPSLFSSGVDASNVPPGSISMGGGDINVGFTTAGGDIVIGDSSVPTNYSEPPLYDASQQSIAYTPSEPPPMPEPYISEPTQVNVPTEFVASEPTVNYTSPPEQAVNYEARPAPDTIAYTPSEMAAPTQSFEFPSTPVQGEVQHNVSQSHIADASVEQQYNQQVTSSQGTTEFTQTSQGPVPQGGLNQAVPPGQLNAQNVIADASGTQQNLSKSLLTGALGAAASKQGGLIPPTLPSGGTQAKRSQDVTIASTGGVKSGADVLKEHGAYVKPEGEEEEEEGKKPQDPQNPDVQTG